MPSRKKLSPEEIDELLTNLNGWGLNNGMLRAEIETGNFNAGVELVNKIAKVADELDHHPDIKLTYPKVEIEMKTHDVDGITEFDFELARKIEQLAR